MLDQRIGVLRPFTSGGVVRKLGRRKLRPRLFDGRDNAPFRLDLVAASEQSRVTAHRVQQESLISYRSGCPKRVAIGKIHVDAAGAHLRSGSLDRKSTR